MSNANHLAQLCSTLLSNLGGTAQMLMRHRHRHRLLLAIPHAHPFQAFRLSFFLLLFAETFATRSLPMERSIFRAAGKLLN